MEELLAKEEKVLLETSRKSSGARGALCILTGITFAATLFAENIDGWVPVLLVLAAVMLASGIYFMIAGNESVWVTDKRVMHYRLCPTQKSLFRVVSIPMESIASIQFMKRSVMFGDKVFGDVIITRKEGGRCILHSLCEGEFVAECVGKSLKTR